VLRSWYSTPTGIVVVGEHVKNGARPKAGHGGEPQIAYSAIDLSIDLID